MADKINAEVFILVDSSGDYAIGMDGPSARDTYEETIQSLTDCDGFRLVKVTVAVPLPAVVELAGEVPAVEPAGSLVITAS